MRLHGLETRLLDNHGLASRRATRKFLAEIDKIKPDIIHLHNIHGYYLNYKILFDYIAEQKIPVVWTLHDCWSFTGHCAHFIFAGCDKWLTGCDDKCVCKRDYPGTLLCSRSAINYKDKKQAFTKPSNVTMVPASDWLASLVRQSFLGVHKVHRIYNGVDLAVFKPQEVECGERKLLLGVSSVWSPSKGLDDFFQLRRLLPKEKYEIVLIGMEPEQISALPEGITGLPRTNGVEELVKWYCKADVFVNPSHADTFPTVNLEALACGTPIVTYSGTGGSAEAVDSNTGAVVPNGEVEQMAQQIAKLVAEGSKCDACRARAVELFDKEKRFEEYIALYDEILNNNKEK